MGFHERYSDEQREALAVAYAERRIRPARRVVALAAAGELEYNGAPLLPFEAKESTVRTLGSALLRRRAGLATSQLAAAPPSDAVEALRRRLVNAADAGVSELERRRRGKGGVDFERLRQAARAVREIAAIPGSGEPRPPAPGATVNGVRDGGATRGGLAGEILRAHRQRSQPEPAASEQRPRVEAPEQSSPAERGADAAGGPAAELAN